MQHHFKYDYKNSEFEKIVEGYHKLYDDYTIRSTTGEMILNSRNKTKIKNHTDLKFEKDA